MVWRCVRLRASSDRAEILPAYGSPTARTAPPPDCYFPGALLQTCRALTLYHTGDADSAADLMQQVLKQHPKMHGVRPVLAMCLSAKGDQEAAAKEITEQVKEAAAADHDAAYWLASAYAVAG